jgi:hypothetical protein
MPVSFSGFMGEIFAKIRCHLALCLALFVAPTGFADVMQETEFKADHYTRDLSANTIVGKGNAWLRRGKREIWADQIDIDLNTNRAVGNGNVHIKDGPLEMWATHADYNLKGPDSYFEVVTIITGTLVFTGATARRLDETHLEINDGTYSNCNSEYIKNPSVNQCPLDWKISGRHFSVTFEEYVHVQDVLVFVKGLPAFYLPYFVASIKSKRQTGLLMPSITYTTNLGNGVTIPFFWALSPWNDLTLTPTYYDKTGYHLGVDYRYAYSPDTKGEANFFLLQRRFNPDPFNPEPEDTGRSRFLGLIGEWAVNIKNTVSLGGRAHSLQELKLVSNPYYNIDYGSDFPDLYTMPALRSQFAVTAPSDETLFTANLDHYQSLLQSTDSGVDRGSVTQFPNLSFYKANTSLWDRYLSYETDLDFNNFYRPGVGYDSLSTAFNPSSGEVVHSDPNSNFHLGDYIRTGQRIHIEPRLIANVPLSTGFQLQPTLKAGSLVYHFDIPNSNIAHREYLDAEIPFSLYLSRQFETGIAGYEKLVHIFQPRIVYAKNLYQTDSMNPFFYTDPVRVLQNPMYDLADQLNPYEYLRLELINRVLRSGPTGAERFFLLQVSEQYNIVTIPASAGYTDPTFQNPLGPIEVLGEFTLWRFSGQVQGDFQMTPMSPTQPLGNDLSSSLTYGDPSGDRISIGNHFTINTDPTQTEGTVTAGFYKILPVLFDIEGAAEYSYQHGSLYGAHLSFIFGARPPSCWGFTVTVGQNDLQQQYAQFIFRLDFGQPSTNMKSSL